MKKTALASALAVAIGGTATVAEANTAGLTGVWTGTYTFAMFSLNGGAVGAPTAPQAWTFSFESSPGAGDSNVSISNTTTFYASVWTAFNVTAADNGTSYGGAGAQNMTFSWSVNPNIPVTETWDVTATGNAAGDTAVVSVISALILPTSSAFPGFSPQFSGTLSKVPVPAAVWLMGSGLIGLVGVARRRRRS